MARDLTWRPGSIWLLLLLGGCQLMVADYSFKDGATSSLPDTVSGADRASTPDAAHDGAVHDGAETDAFGDRDAELADARQDRAAPDASIDGAPLPDAAQDDDGAIADAATQDASDPEPLSPVEDYYPGFGRWNDYIQRDPAFGWYSQPCSGGCTPCDPERGLAMPDSCLHGGEKKVVYYQQAASCADLSARDDLEAFAWECLDEGGWVRFVSQGLMPGSGLRDLLTDGGDGVRFIPNAVSILDGQGRLLAQTESTVWWNNPLERLRGNEQTLGDTTPAGTIYVVTTPTQTGGIGLHYEGAGLVTLPGAALSFNGNAGARCDVATGAIGGPYDPGQDCVLSAFDAAFLWIEAVIDARSPVGTRATVGLNVVDVAHARVRNTSAVAAVRINLYLARVTSSLFYGVTLADAHGSPFAANGWGDPSSSHNVFHGLRVYNSGGQGLILDGAHNAVVHGLFTGNSGDGIFLVAPNTLAHITAVNNGDTGISLPMMVDAGVGAVAQLLAVNNGGYGLEAGDIDGLDLANLVLTNNAWGPLAFTADVHARGRGAWLVDGLCLPGTSTDPGIDESCEPVDPPSTHSVIAVDPPAEPPLVAAIAEDDATNGSDDLGARVYQEIDDWIGFDSWYRTWGRNGASNPVLDDLTRGPCASQESCGIWDWRLRTDSELLWERSGNGISVNEPVAIGSECPTAVVGALKTVESVHGTFLINAQEVMLDSQGDEDGLCESDERCLFSPNQGGAYQGEASSTVDRVGPCLFTSGSVEGVTMYGLPVNGGGP